MTGKEFDDLKTAVKKIAEKTHEPEHSFDHGERVAKNALKIADLTGLKDKIDLNLLQLACLVHDIPISLHKFSFKRHILERWIVKRDLPGILDKLNLEEGDKKIIFRAVLNHPYAYPYHKLNKDKDYYSKVLQDSDTLDFFSARREEILRRNEGLSLWYREMNFFGGMFFSFGRKHLSRFLNYPQAADLYE